MTDDPRSSVMDEMAEAALDVWFGHKLWRASPDRDDRTREQFERSERDRMTRSIKAALALDPLRQPMNNTPSVAITDETVAAALDAYRARRFMENDALSHYEMGIVHQTIGAAPDVEFLDDSEAKEYMRGYRAHAIAEAAGVEWRRPEEYRERKKLPVFMSRDNGDICAWYGNTLPSDGVAWAEMPAPPAWATQSPERRSDNTPTQTIRVKPDAIFRTPTDWNSANVVITPGKGGGSSGDQHAVYSAASGSWHYGAGGSAPSQPEIPSVAALAGGVEAFGYKGHKVWRTRVAACGREDCSKHLMCGNPYKCGAEAVPSAGYISKDKFYPASPLPGPNAEPVRKESLRTDPPFPPWSADAAELLFSIANSVWFLLRATAAAVICIIRSKRFGQSLPPPRRPPMPDDQRSGIR